MRNQGCTVIATGFPTKTQRILNLELLYAVPGYACFFYILLPFRFWQPFVFPNQTEVVVITLFFACALLFFTILKVYKTTTFQFGEIDLFLAIYGIYLLCRLRYPVEKEYFFQAFSIVCIYLYFRNFPENYFKGILFLLPLAGVIQIAEGINRFTQPWHNLSHITGIFGNTGLFGGFAALGFVVCAGMFFSLYSGRKAPRSIIQYTMLVLISFTALILARQVLASGSRASWLATLGATLFLLHWFVPLKKLLPNRRWLRYFLALCLLVLFVFFSKHLYDLKKDSADGRILIGRVSVEMVKDAPVFGSGISGFKAGYMNRQAGYFQVHPNSPYLLNADDVQTPFNEFLKILIEQGITGLLLFFCLLYCIKHEGAKARKHEVIIQSVILFILIFGLFSYPFDKLPFVVLFISSLAILSRSKRPVFAIRPFRAFTPSRFRAISLLAILILCLTSLKIAGNAHSYAGSCKAWNKALSCNACDMEGRLLQLKKLYPDLKNNSVFLTTYGKTLSRSKQYREAAIVLEEAVKRQPLSGSYIELGKSYEAEGCAEKALACWKRASLMVPARFTPLYLTMKLHFKNREYESARKYAEQLLAKKTKIDNPEITPMKREAQYILNFHPPPE